MSVQKKDNCYCTYIAYDYVLPVHLLSYLLFVCVSSSFYLFHFTLIFYHFNYLLSFLLLYTVCKAHWVAHVHEMHYIHKVALPCLLKSHTNKLCEEATFCAAASILNHGKLLWRLNLFPNPHWCFAIQHPLALDDHQHEENSQAHHHCLKPPEETLLSHSRVTTAQEQTRRKARW